MYCATCTYHFNEELRVHDCRVLDISFCATPFFGIKFKFMLHGPLDIVTSPVPELTIISISINRNTCSFFSVL